MPLRPLATAVLLVLLMAACGGEPASTAAAPSPAPTAPADPEPPAERAAGTEAAEMTEAAGTAAPAPATPSAQAASCAAPEQLPIQGGEHLIGDNPPPVPYSSSPPTSGWHASGAFDVMVQPVDQPLSEPRQVSVLEAGGVVITYTGLDDATRNALEEHVRAHFDGRVAVTPYEPLPNGAVAFAAWGLLQRCDGLDLTALDAFVNAHADAEVTTGHSH